MVLLSVELQKLCKLGEQIPGKRESLSGQTREGF